MLICAFSGSRGSGGWIIFSTTPGNVTLGFSGTNSSQIELANFRNQSVSEIVKNYCRAMPEQSRSDALTFSCPHDQSDHASRDQDHSHGRGQFFIALRLYAHFGISYLDPMVFRVRNWYDK